MAFLQNLPSKGTLKSIEQGYSCPKYYDPLKESDSQIRVIKSDKTSVFLRVFYSKKLREDVPARPSLIATSSPNSTPDAKKRPLTAEEIFERDMRELEEEEKAAKSLQQAKAKRAATSRSGEYSPRQPATQTASKSPQPNTPKSPKTVSSKTPERSTESKPSNVNTKKSPARIKDERVDEAESKLSLSNDRSIGKPGSYSEMMLPELRRLCLSLGIPENGNRADIIKRLEKLRK